MKKREFEDGYGIYIHIPFCVKKCNYCDFLSFSASRALQDAYVEALLGEIKAASLEGRGEVTSIFIGGGTPSMISGEWIYSILQAVRQKYPLAEDIEISLEANPGTMDKAKMEDWRRAGVNRLSIGLQSANDHELALLGRIHSWEEFLENYHLARELGFSNINIDLMLAIPDQTMESWKESLWKVLRLKPEHISAYSLLVEPGTPFWERELSLPEEDVEREMYFYTRDFLESWGYHSYEISNFAKEGRECRHNLGYWKRFPYLAFGLGASSFTGEERYRNTRNMTVYIENSREGKMIQRDRQRLTKEDAMEEFFFLGLRMTEGVREEDFFRCFGCEVDAVFGDVLKKYQKMGLLGREEGSIFFSEEGISVSNRILADLLLERES